MSKDDTVIKYIGGGMFGDFIMQLSIVNEIYLKTRQKGIVYITDKIGDGFNNGLINTYNDMYNVIMKQEYIKDFKIHNGEDYNINLSKWRESPMLFKVSFYIIYKSIYNVEWGTHSWLKVEKDNKWSDRIVVHASPRRYFNKLDINKLYNMFDDKLVFVSPVKEEYEYFKEKSRLNIEYYKTNNFTELCKIINSCRLFIGGLSGLLCIANALEIPRIPFYTGDKCADGVHMTDMKGICKNLYYSLEEYDREYIVLKK